MLVKRFKFKRNNDKGGFQWTAESEIERPGFYRGFTAVGKTLADVKEFAALVRSCERLGSLERLSEMHPPGFENQMQTTWGGNWYLHNETGNEHLKRVHAVAVGENVQFVGPATVFPAAPAQNSSG
jgi:hypothetical protein